MKHLTLWQWIKLTWTGYEARKEYFELEARAGSYLDELARIDDPKERARLLFKVGRIDAELAGLSVKGWRSDLEDDEHGIDMAQSMRFAGVLCRLLGDVEQAVAYPDLGRRERTTHLERACGEILDKMAATLDLAERLTYLDPLYDAVVGNVGGQAAEAIACLPAPVNGRNWRLR